MKGFADIASDEAFRAEARALANKDAILFSAPMVRSILAGEKSQTRPGRTSSLTVARCHSPMGATPP